MMDKEKFVYYLDALKKYQDWEMKLYDLGVNFWEKEELQNLVGGYIELLNEVSGDVRKGEYNTDIEFFIYDCDYGNNSDKYYIVEDDGTETHIHTAEELWDYIHNKNVIKV